ncbi:MAG: hypothetical protein MI866_10720 [Bacteroidales bacterium]|nr:hypothetical protein [Bacteroidales bacterium]
MTKLKRNLIVIALLVCSSAVFAIDRNEFYAVFSGNSPDDISELISRLEKEEPCSQINAYKGALYMKQSSFMKEARKKIDTFKKGKSLLEHEIMNHSNNVEYRFLRLVVQEKSPPILKYKKNIASDKEILLSHFAELDSCVKKYVINYSRQSKKLDEKEFK